MKKLIKKVVVVDDMKSDAKESWLDAIKDSQVIKFCKTKFKENESMAGSTLIRHCNQHGATIAFTIEKTGGNIYVLSEYLISQNKESGFSELDEDWILFISKANSKKTINGQVYLTQAIDMAKSIIGSNDKQLKDFIYIVESSNKNELL